MTRKLQGWLVLIAWLLASGAQWDLLQVIAWGRMFAQYSQVMDISEAAKMTFGGDMCKLCRVVESAKEQQKELPLGEAAKDKFLLICQVPMETVLEAPVFEAWPQRDLWPPAEARGRPPTPPPRSV